MQMIYSADQPICYQQSLYNFLFLKNQQDPFYKIFPRNIYHLYLWLKLTIIYTLMGGKKDKNKNKNKDNKQPQQPKEPINVADIPKAQAEIKDQGEKTQTSLQSQSKVEEVPNDIKVNESNSISEDPKVEPPKNIDVPIESKIGQSNLQAPQQQASNQSQQQPQRIQQQVQIPAKQEEQKVTQAEEQIVKQQLPVQHISQPLQVIQEKSGENLTSHIPSQEIERTLTEEQTGNAPQAKAEENIPQISNNVQSDRLQNQVVDTLPVESQNVNETGVEKVAQISQKSNQAYAESLPQREIDIALETQHKTVSQSNFDKVEQKQQEQPSVVPSNLNYTESFVSIQGEQQRQRQQRQAFSTIKQTINQQVQEREQPIIQNKVEQNKSTNEIINQNEVLETTQLPKNQQLANRQVVLEHSADNIQILQHSVPYQVEVQEERLRLPQNQVVHETICITESVDVQKLIEGQQRPNQTYIQPSYVQVKPEVVEVHDCSNNVLDINQPIQLVEDVKEVSILPACQPQKESVLASEQERQPQKPQNQQVVISQKVVDPADNKIFTLVQSQEIPVAEVEKQVNIEVSTQIAPTQINVKESLSFSDLNFSVERSAGRESLQNNHENQRKQQVKENVENKVAESQPENVAEVVQPIKTIEVHYTNLNQPIKGLEQSLSRPVEVLVQQKLVQVPTIVEVKQVTQIRVEQPSEAVSVLVENTQEIPIKSVNIEVLKESESNNQQREGESNVSQRQDLSATNRQAIVQEARIKEEVQEKIVKIVPANDENTDNQKKQNSKKNSSSLVQKLVISSSTIIAGGIAWGLTKSPQKSLLFSAIGLGAGIITAQLLK